MDAFETETYPLPQAAFVLQEPVADVRRAVERNEVDYHLVRLGGRRIRALDYPSLVFLSWAKTNAEDLTPALRRKCYESLRDRPTLPTFIEAGFVRARLDAAKKSVRERLKTLKGLDRQVETNAAGETVLKGTDIEVHRIAALLEGGVSAQEVLNDYPSLDLDRINFSRAYAATHPKAGHPFPKLTAKAAMRQVDFSVLDLDD